MPDFPHTVSVAFEPPGMTALQAKQFDQAVAAWEAVEKGNHRPSIAEATVLRANLLLGQKKIPPKDAIVELEKLRYAWRGGEFELDPHMGGMPPSGLAERLVIARLDEGVEPLVLGPTAIDMFGHHLDGVRPASRHRSRDRHHAVAHTGKAHASLLR